MRGRIDGVGDGGGELGLRGCEAGVQGGCGGARGGCLKFAQ